MNPKMLIGLAVIAAVLVSGSGSAATPQGVKGKAVCSQDGLICRTTIDAQRGAGTRVSGTVRIEYDLSAIGMGLVRCEARVDSFETKDEITWLGAVVTSSSRPGMLPVGRRLEMRVRALGSGQLEMLNGRMLDNPVTAEASTDQAAQDKHGTKRE